MQDPFEVPKRQDASADSIKGINLHAFDSYDQAFVHCLELLEERETLMLEHDNRTVAQSARTTFYRTQHRFGVKLSWRILNNSQSVLTLTERYRTAKPASRASDYALILLHYNESILIALATLLVQEAIENCLIICMHQDDLEPFKEKLSNFNLNYKQTSDGLLFLPPNL